MVGRLEEDGKGEMLGVQRRSETGSRSILFVHVNAPFPLTNEEVKGVRSKLEV